MSYFNDDQLDHMRDLADASKKGLTCPCGWFLKTECERTCNSAYGSPEKHIAGQADVLIARLRHLVSLNEPRHGGPYQGTAAMACVRAMGEAADRIASLTEQVEGLTRERDDALATIALLQSQYRKQQEHDTATIERLERERDKEAEQRALWAGRCGAEFSRADAAEAREKRLREALEPFTDISGEGDEDFPDDTKVVVTFGRSTVYTLKLGDFRRAALEAKDE